MTGAITADERTIGNKRTVPTYPPFLDVGLVSGAGERHKAVTQNEGEPMHRRVGSIALVMAVALAFVVTGCTAPGPSYSILDREATSEDVVPDALPAYAGDSAVLDTSRFVAERDGIRIWLLRGQESSTVCLLAFPGAEDWVMACGGDHAPASMSGPAGEYVYQPDGLPAPKDSTRISENVFAVDDR